MELQPNPAHGKKNFFVEWAGGRLQRFIAMFRRKGPFRVYRWDENEGELSQQATEFSTGTPMGMMACEINVSKKGKHIFATDSTIRGYNEVHLVDVIKLFREKFPSSEGYKFTITCWNVYASELPKQIQEALECSLSLSPSTPPTSKETSPGSTKKTS